MSRILLVAIIALLVAYTYKAIFYIGLAVYIYLIAQVLIVIDKEDKDN